MKSNIIIMLTHHDMTVKNAIEVFDSCKDLPVQFWGFKDVGLEREKMAPAGQKYEGRRQDHVFGGGHLF